ncbi:MAG: histidinol dehydrogenase [Solirubrobacteraceae bacterium]|nr:histidinol dehydrogenase [Solirubrobacteraceae bacterium]
MRLERVEVGPDPVATAARVRALAPAPQSVSAAVAEIVETVRAGGDRALRELVARFDSGGTPGAGGTDSLRVAPEQLDTALLDDDVRAGLEVAIANVALVADAGVGSDVEVHLPQGHRVVLREVPVRRAAIYVPGGRAPYPSSLVMGVVTARAAGVEEVVVLTPPPIAPVIRGACALCGVHEVYAMGGAHGIAALAYGTESIERVDVIAGPGSLIVQEAKRQVSDSVGIDGFYGPSDVLVLADATADARLVALDLLAQGEHGPGAPVVAVSDSDAFFEALEAQLVELGPQRPASHPAAFVLARAGTLRDALAFAEAFAPEHLELVGPDAERLARRVRCSGCVFVGAAGATAFGDYVAGSNHSLPTGGSARFASGLSARHFRRRYSEVHVGTAAPALAAAGAPIARAEGFDVHAESMEARVAGPVGENPPS